jgi:hypothetical protein
VAANRKALEIASECLQHSDMELNELRDLIATVAGLQGDGNLAQFIFLSSEELSCPECGAAINFAQQ